MFDAFDARVVPREVLEVVRACQARVPCALGGGAALSGAHLGHRLSRDVDLVCRRAEDVRSLVREFSEIARQSSSEIVVVRDAGTFVRANVKTATGSLELDAIYEATPPLELGDALEGVALESLTDLRASKLTCLLSRSEPRDLVDLCFLDRSGYSPEADLPSALKKDAGIDPGVLAWLLGQFPLSPLPTMLAALTVDDLRAFRDGLRERFRVLAVGE